MHWTLYFCVDLSKLYNHVIVSVICPSALGLTPEALVSEVVWTQFVLSTVFLVRIAQESWHLNRSVSRNLFSFILLTCIWPECNSMHWLIYLTWTKVNTFFNKNLLTLITMNILCPVLFSRKFRLINFSHSGSLS